MLYIYQTRSNFRLSGERIRRYVERLPNAMHSEIFRFRRWEDRQASLFGRLLLLHALHTRYPQWGPSVLERWEKAGTGKPFISGAPDFSISHSGEVVMLAMVECGSIGIDVEKVRPVNIDDFSQYLPEMSTVLKAPEGLNLFYACWTKKEAVLKGEGIGLQAPLEQVKLSVNKAFYHDRIWHLKEIECGTGYCAHVATTKHQADYCVEILNF